MPSKSLYFKSSRRTAIPRNSVMFQDGGLRRVSRLLRDLVNLPHSRDLVLRQIFNHSPPTGIDCEQSLVFLCKVSAKPKHASGEAGSREKLTSWFAIALGEITTRRILREKADCKQSTTRKEIQSYPLRMPPPPPSTMGLKIAWCIN